MRGKGSFVLLLGELIRITPACAGKSLVQLFQNLHHEDHPRVCGEKLSLLLLSKADRGSPPRMRGKEFWAVHQLPPLGITPAYAGKSHPKS